MMLGWEQVHHPDLSQMEKAYIAVFGMPIVGLRIRGRNLFSLIPEKSGYSRILDAGSGPGVFTFALARRFPGAEVAGIDLQPEAITACRHIAKKSGISNVGFRNTSIENIQDRDLYDLIVCIDILEHISNDTVALERLHRACRGGGTLVLHVPSLYRRYPVCKVCKNFDVEGHVRPGYTMTEIEQKVQNAGFVIQGRGYTYGFLETLANNISYMITKARKRNKAVYAVAFPLLNLLSWFGACARPQKLGAGIFIVAGKPDDSLSGEKTRTQNDS